MILLKLLYITVCKASNYPNADHALPYIFGTGVSQYLYPTGNGVHNPHSVFMPNLNINIRNDMNYIPNNNANFINRQIAYGGNMVSLLHSTPLVNINSNVGYAQTSNNPSSSRAFLPRFVPHNIAAVNPVIGMANNINIPYAQGSNDLRHNMPRLPMFLPHESPRMYPNKVMDKNGHIFYAAGHTNEPRDSIS